jgi:hypothetical protein
MFPLKKLTSKISKPILVNRAARFIQVANDALPSTLNTNTEDVIIINEIANIA